MGGRGKPLPYIFSVNFKFFDKLKWRAKPSIQFIHQRFSSIHFFLEYRNFVKY